MIDHLLQEWPRYIALAEMGALISCFIALHFGSRAVLPRMVYLCGWGVLYVFVVVTSAIVINVTNGEPPTIGLQVMTIILAPAALGGIVAVVVAVRDNNRH